MGVGAAFMIFNNENIIGVKHYRLPPLFTVQHINRIDRKNRQRLANELIDKSTDNIVVVWNKVDKTESWYHRLKKYAK
ncbi:hypothetical protein DERF_002672 [Dermatophagoides farinae]|uniref:Uncharacterized protein n=1 Tax=Dermatophagoides farinae TaxID=6954 RepID=A0A922IE73_DERFA|nr:hypothetical protein DERF_002672 [Dermatophagoides farinae]